MSWCYTVNYFWHGCDGNWAKILRTFIFHQWITAISFVPPFFFPATSANIYSNEVHELFISEAKTISYIKR